MKVIVIPQVRSTPDIGPQIWVPGYRSPDISPRKNTKTMTETRKCKVESSITITVLLLTCMGIKEKYTA